jgi:hypothetical protein
MPYYTCDPQLELNGRTFLSFFTNIQYDVIQPHLERYGLTDVNPDGWYPLQTALDILTAISQDEGSMMNMVAIGIAAAEVSPIPQEVLQMPFDEFLFLYQKLYQTRHRNGDPGWVRAERMARGHVRMTLKIPYPDDIFYGLFYGFATRFLARGVSRIIEYDPDMPTREQGGDVTVIHVIWDER